MGVDINNFDQKNPDDVSAIHDIIADELKLPNKQQQALFTNILLTPDRKPNLIFDVTLKDMAKMVNLCYEVKRLGYEKKKIHIIWVINDVEVAMEQNKKRDRVVHPRILLDTHMGVSITIKQILDMGDDLKEFMDGNIVFSFNMAEVDTHKVKGNSEKSGYVTKADYVYVKKAGQRQLSSSELSDEVVNKIRERLKGANSGGW